MERWVAKCLALIGSFILPLVCTLLPYKVSDYISRRGDSGKHMLSYLMCLGGGIFFGTYLLHMGPEVRKILNDSLMVPYHIEYPLPDLFVGVGFFIVLFSEKIVLRWNKRRMEKKRRKMPCMLDGRADDVKRRHDSIRCARRDSQMCDECVAGLPCSGTDEEHFMDKTTRVDEGIVKLVTTIDIEDLDRDIMGAGCNYQNECPLSGTGGCCSDSTEQNLTEKERNIIVSMKVDEKKKKEVDDDNMHSHSHHHATRSIILILALSLHRIFEGMSIGLQSSVQNVGHLFLAVMCHETVIGFSLGLQFVKSKFPLRRMLVTSFVCSIIMPLGVAMGTAMTETGQQGSWLDVANGILQAVAMGTFVYVTFFEILQEEVSPEDTSIGKIVFIALGFIMMALLDLIPEEQDKLASISPSPLPLNSSTTLDFVTSSY